MPDDSTPAPLGEWGALQAEWTRHDTTMCVQLVTRATAEDFEVREFRGWAWQLAARLLADPKTPRRSKLRLIEKITARTDPEPKQAGLEAHLHGNLVIQWSSPSPTALEPAKPSSTNGSKTNGHAPPSSSATDALANL